ncbi:MAG: CoA-binding protein [Meiothermus sp.]|nr:CoA-binding protein [Meiothermus sp.]
MQEATQDFLAQKNIAVVGVSSTKDDAANAIYRKLRAEGYKVFAVNPKATTLEGDPAYPDLKSISERVDAAVIVTRPEVTEQIVEQCASLGIRRVWMHKGMGSSVSEKAVAYGRSKGLTVIPGGCPMMYGRTADFGHRCIRWFMDLTGGIPKQV